MILHATKLSQPVPIPFHSRSAPRPLRCAAAVLSPLSMVCRDVVCQCRGGGGCRKPDNIIVTIELGVRVIRWRHGDHLKDVLLPYLALQKKTTHAAKIHAAHVKDFESNSRKIGAQGVAPAADRSTGNYYFFFHVAS
eukprot:g68801.t1